MKKLLLIILLIVGCEETVAPLTKHGCIDSQACNYDADATLDNNSCLYVVGCDDICGSDKAVDNCGVCDADTTNDCIKDCADVWGGDKVADNCGVCDSDSTNDGATDNCGVCDNDSTNDCTVDCAGVYGGTSWVSDCGCVSATNLGDDCDDCAGTPNGTATTDDCGICDTDTSNDCVQCTYVWGQDSSLCGEFNYCYPSDSTNTTFSFSKHQGKVFMIIFSATWCMPCKGSISEVEEIYKYWVNDNRVEIVYFLDDIGQPYTCSSWGGLELDGIPPIVDDGETDIFNLFENPNGLGIYPLIIFINGAMEVAEIWGGGGSYPTLTEANNIIEGMLE